jgi:hypothetical protein
LNTLRFWVVVWWWHLVDFVRVLAGFVKAARAQKVSVHRALLVALERCTEIVHDEALATAAGERPWLGVADGDA